MQRQITRKFIQRIKGYISVFMLSSLFCFTFTQSSLAQCTSRVVSNTVHCQNGSDYVVWLHNGNKGYRFVGDPANYLFQECGDGTAEFTATGLTNPQCPGEIISIYSVYSNRTTQAPSDSPKNNRCNPTDASDWIYYTSTGGTLTSSTRGTYDLSRRGPSFQLGDGANETGTGLGASGWFNLNNGNNYWKRGDVNILLSPPEATPDPLPTECGIRTVSNTILCTNNKEYVVWLNDGNRGYHFKGDVSKYVFQENSDGTAEFKATGLTSIELPGEVIDITVLYSGKTSQTPADSPKNNICGPTDASEWVYYTGAVGTVTSNNHGTFTTNRMGPSFQLGVGANQTGVGLGASGWFTMAAGDGHWKKGDVNILLTPLETCPPIEDPGQIEANETKCEAYFAETIEGTAASGMSNCDIEYQWQYRVEDGWKIIPGANQKDFNPGYITETTRYRRRAKYEQCNRWKRSNVVIKKVQDPVEVIVDQVDADCGKNNGKIIFTFPDNAQRTHIGLSIDGGQTYKNRRDNSGSFTFKRLAPGTYDLKVRWGNQDCPKDIDDVTIIDLGNSKPSDPGTLSGKETQCESYMASTITGTPAMGNNNESISYQWQKKYPGGPWENIEGATGLNYEPGLITETTHFRRRAKGENNCGWARTNVISKRVKLPVVVEVSKKSPDCGETNGTITFSFPDNPQRSHIAFSIDSGQTYKKVKDNTGSYTFTSLGAGIYPIMVKWGNNDCPKVLDDVKLSSGDNDNDGICNADDCAPDDPTYPGTPGTPCDDFDSTTENDQITSDGCGCAGTPVSVCDNFTYGGIIGIGGFTEVDFCEGAYVPAIESLQDPTGGSGDMEVVWIMRPSSVTIEDCQDAVAELQPYNVGQLYNEYIANGGSPQIGSTTWQFVTDSDGNDLQLTLGSLSTSACFMRCARRVGCERFTGESNLMRIEVNGGLSGGTIAVAKVGESDPSQAGIVICEGDPVPLIGTSIFDPNGDPSSATGEDLEIVWIRTTNSNDPFGAVGELNGLNVGQLYNNFVANGMTYPYITGTTWQFVTDNDGNDLTLTLPNLAESSSFLRCARAVGDVRFCGESSMVTVEVEECSTDPVPCTFQRCGASVTIWGTSAQGFSSIKITDADDPLMPTVYSCHMYNGTPCADPQSITLPNATGNYNFEIVCDIGSHWGAIPSGNCGGALQQQDGDGTLTDNRRMANEADEANLDVPSIVNAANGDHIFKVYPIPADDELFANLSKFLGKPVEVTLLNSLGQVLVRRTYEELSKSEIGFDVSAYENGVYFLRAYSGEQLQESKKFVIRRGE